MDCSRCKRTLDNGEEVMVEGKGVYVFDPEGETVTVTDQTAVFCMACDRASYEEEVAEREEAQSNPGNVADVGGPTLASTPEETGTRDESNPGSVETKLTGDAQVDEGGGLDPVDMEVDPYKL